MDKLNTDDTGKNEAGTYNNILFVKVPKVASNSIITCLDIKQVQDPEMYFNFSDVQLIPDERLLWVNTANRVNIIDAYERWFRLKQNNIFTFGFVRNPWDRAVSSWKFGSWVKEWNNTFPEFCKHLQTLDLGTGRPGPRALHACEQYPMLVSEQNNIKADFIGRFENLESDLDRLCSMLGCKRKELPHANKTEHKHYTEYYDDETRKIIADVYRRDIEYFGYKFDE